MDSARRLDHNRKMFVYFKFLLTLIWGSNKSWDPVGFQFIELDSKSKVLMRWNVFDVWTREVYFRLFKDFTGLWTYFGLNLGSTKPFSLLFFPFFQFIDLGLNRGDVDIWVRGQHFPSRLYFMGLIIYSITFLGHFFDSYLL